MAFQMAVVIGGGVLLGKYLDQKFPQTLPIFTIVMSLLAVFIAIFQVIREVIKMSKKDD